MSEVGVADLWLAEDCFSQLRGKNFLDKKSTPETDLTYRIMVLEGKPVVLVVDGDHLVTFSMAELLRSAGYLAVTAPTSALAIETAFRVAVDIAIVDIRLPDSNGVETAMQIRKTLPDCKILLITGHANYEHLLDNARAQGFDFEVLAKPISPPDLLTRLELLYSPKATKAS